jgi:hypothetical protein
MDNQFYYAQSAKRRAKKMKALEEGQQEQQRREAARGKGIHTPLWEHRPPKTDDTQGPEPRGRTATRPGSSRAVKPGGPQKAPSPQQARPAARTQAVRRPTRGTPGQKARPSPPLVASKERQLLESADLDLFNKGQTSMVSVCPECRHELVKVHCLGTAVKVCTECKGTWLPYSVVQEFARQQDWFRQLGPAAQLVRDKMKKR